MVMGNDHIIENKYIAEVKQISCIVDINDVERVVKSTLMVLLFIYCEMEMSF